MLAKYLRYTGSQLAGRQSATYKPQFVCTTANEVKVGRHKSSTFADIKELLTEFDDRNLCNSGKERQLSRKRTRGQTIPPNLNIIDYIQTYMKRKKEAIKLLLIFDSIPPTLFYLVQPLFNIKTRQSTKASPCHSSLRNTRRWRSKQDSSHLHSNYIPVFNSREEFSTYYSQLNAWHEAQLLLRAPAVSLPTQTQPPLCGDPNK